jgi:hypothetical protein
MVKVGVFVFKVTSKSLSVKGSKWKAPNLKGFSMTEPEKILLIEEEYGFRYWVARISSNQVDEITQWWVSLPSVRGMFFNPADQFPIPIIQLTDENEDEYEMDKKNVALLIHIHEDCDSYLKVVDGDLLHHAGYCEDVD